MEFNEDFYDELDKGSPETAFYKGWVLGALLGGELPHEDLYDNREKLLHMKGETVELLGDDDAATVRRNIDEIVEIINREIEARSAETLNELRQKVFSEQLFQVAIVTDDTELTVDDFAISGRRIVPVIGGEAYLNAIDDVVFYDNN